VSDFTVRKARQRTASNIAVETRTGKDGKAQTMPMTPGLVLRELLKSRRGRGVRTVYSESFVARWRIRLRTLTRISSARSAE